MAKCCKACPTPLVGPLRGHTYCPPCSPLKDAAWRQSRGAAAAAGTKRGHKARMQQTFGKMTPEQAGAHGYGVGYRRAYTYWKRWADKRIAQIQKEQGA